MFSPDTSTTRPDIVLPPNGRHEQAAITFVGTATVLLRCLGFTVLTDPNFLHQGEHAPLGYGLRTRRLIEPALGPDDLPPIDVVVLSHHHGDHFDHRAAEGLDKDLCIVTTRHAARKLRRQGFRRPTALRTWECQRLVRGDHSLTITALPAKHAPQPLRTLLPPVMGSLLEHSVDGAVRRRVYVSGDTLDGDHLDAVRERFPDIDVAVMHLGGTRVLAHTVTMDAAQGVGFLRRIGPAAAVPVHYDDYRVFRSPLSDFLTAAKAAGLATEVRTVGRGDTVSLE